MLKVSKKIPFVLIGILVVIGAYTFLSSILIQDESTSDQTVDHWLALANDAGIECSGAKDYYWTEDFPGYFEYEVENGSLIVLVCETFAHQSNYVGIYTTGNDFEILTFSVPDDSEEDGWQSTEVPIGLSYDPENIIFTRHEKSRGLGDCGFVASYQWNEANKTADFLEWEFTECVDIYE